MRDPQGSASPTVGWKVVLTSVVGLGLGGVLLAARILPILTSARDFEDEYLLLSVAGGLVLVALAILVCTWIALLLHGRRWAVWPLLAGVIALSVPFWPLAPILRELDDRLHGAARAELVRRVEAGEFSPWSRYGDMISLPPDYAWAVSRCGGNRLASVQLVDGALRMTFCGLSGWIVYDALGRAPDLAVGLRGFGFTRVEPLREHWYWLSVSNRVSALWGITGVGLAGRGTTRG